MPRYNLIQELDIDDLEQFLEEAIQERNMEIASVLLAEKRRRKLDAQAQQVQAGS